MFTATFKFTKYDSISLCVDISLIDKTQRYLVQNGCTIIDCEEVPDLGCVHFEVVDMPLKLVIANCKRFGIDIIEYYRFKLSNRDILEAYLDYSEDEIIGSIWDEVDYRFDNGDNADWDKAVNSTAQRLKFISYEFK
jgi:hypothetical protein